MTFSTRYAGGAVEAVLIFTRGARDASFEPFGGGGTLCAAERKRLNLKWASGVQAVIRFESMPTNPWLAGHGRGRGKGAAVANGTLEARVLAAHAILSIERSGGARQGRAGTSRTIVSGVAASTSGRTRRVLVLPWRALLATSLPPRVGERSRAASSLLQATCYRKEARLSLLAL